MPNAATWVLLLALTGCTASVGPASWALANGLCIEAAVMGASGSVGHCGEVEEDAGGADDSPPRE